MQFSIFTPSHDTTFLLETYASLLAQTHRDWEWVLVFNNGAVLPRELDDTRIRVVKAPEWINSMGVGALKRFACEQCDGDYLVELDHDDLLLPFALQKLASAIDVYDPDFLYSDFANFRDNGSYELFGKEHGWENYSLRIGEKVHQVNKAFPVSASSLRAIHFAPNHVRVWRRSAYWTAGGHDGSMGVCDDYDLLCRTYLSGAKFHHVEECLYLYRLQANGSNTYLKRNAEIQQKQLLVSNRYLHALVGEWCRRSELPRVDVGGFNAPEGYIAASGKTGFDLRAKWPFADSSVGCIRAYDFLQRVPQCAPGCKHDTPRCPIGVMNEIYRVLAPGGWLLTATPSTSGRGAFQDPTNCSYWNGNSFWYYTKEAQKSLVPGITARYQGARVWDEFPSEWHKQNDILYVYADLVALKGQRQPGICEV
jgi:SAM-dependent methyltransferase